MDLKNTLILLGIVFIDIFLSFLLFEYIEKKSKNQKLLKLAKSKWFINVFVGIVAFIFIGLYFLLFM